MPVKGATKSDYNPESFWFFPWGKSVTHKGVDIFAKKGTEINSSTTGVVLYSGKISLGGNFVVILGPKWRLHYYAHLDEIKTPSLTFVNKESTIGTVGTSGNAAGKSPHLHYAMLTLVPYIWKIDGDKQGWKKMFYLNPIEYL
jgi:murein DD-endopeptidase MepM/ murein hydrolase activator NlpD